MSPHAHALAQLSANDRALFYAHGFGPTRPVPIPIVHHAFEAHARSQPHAIAIEHHAHAESITYAALDAHSDRLAHSLRALSPTPIVPGTRVAILARRSIPFAVAVLAALKAGAQYVPLDAHTITDDTLAYVIADAAPTAVLAMAEFAHRVPTAAADPHVLAIEHEMARAERVMPHPHKVQDLSSPADGAYCIYTSGTTGRPKGVDVRHRGITNVLSGPPANLHLRPGARIAQLLNIAFDMGAWELLGALTNGATLCLRGSTRAEWVRVMQDVDVVIATPTVLAQHEPAAYPRLKRVVVGGEPCPQALADKWASHRPGELIFHNCCGPTEISICNTVTPPHTPGAPLAIGRPIPNTNVYVLCADADDDAVEEEEEEGRRRRRRRRKAPRAVGVGEVGCMWVGGVGVSGGYLGDSAGMRERTRERWRRDPFVASSSQLEEEEEEEEWAKKPDGEWAHPMMFNTGDLGRWRPDGQLEHLGRADDQVKVQGFRVELDGVGAALRAHPQVQNATALLINDALWGFVVPFPSSETHTNTNTDLLRAVRSTALRTQPPYAVPQPAHLVALAAFPVTRNGKVDKRALREVAERALMGVGAVREVREVKEEVKEKEKAQVGTGMGMGTGASRALQLQMAGAQFVLEESLKMVRVDLA